MSNYARGKYAYGFCDLTGFRYPLNELLYTTHEGVRTGLRVGRDVYSPDQPVLGPEAMQTTRIASSIGTVTVTTS